jgi:hypothetical protein
MSNPVTGIRYGVIACASLDPDLVQELFYGHQAVDLSYKAAYDEAKKQAEREADQVEEEVSMDHPGCDDLGPWIEAVWERKGYQDRDDFISCELEKFSDMCEIDEPTIEGEYEGVKYQIGWLGGAPLLWVIEGPIGWAARLCSPCVPNAADLDGGFATGDYYVWVDGDCPDKTPDLEIARRWEKDYLDAGRETYIADADNLVVNETFAFTCYVIPRDWLASNNPD